MENTAVDKLNLVIRRPEERVVVVPKSDRLGLDISFRKQVSIRHRSEEVFPIMFLILPLLLLLMPFLVLLLLLLLVLLLWWWWGW